MAEIHARSMENHDAIILNELCQPVGPTKEIVSKFSRFLGTLARDFTLIPLTYISWRYVPKDDKENIWEYVKVRYLCTFVFCFVFFLFNHSSLYIIWKYRLDLV